MRPKALSTRCTTLRQAASSRTSQARPRCCGPISRAARSAARASRSTMTTRAPSAAKRRAVAQPMPRGDAAPVTIATWSFNGMVGPRARWRGRRDGQIPRAPEARKPPSTGSTMPETYDASSDSRYITADGDLGGGAVAVHRDRLRILLAELVGVQHARHRRVDRPGRDRIRGDAVLGEFDRHLPRQRDHRALRRAVSGAAGADRAHAGDRRDIDDAAPAPAHHQPRRVPARTAACR